MLLVLLKLTYFSYSDICCGFVAGMPKYALVLVLSSSSVIVVEIVVVVVVVVIRFYRRRLQQRYQSRLESLVKDLARRVYLLSRGPEDNI